MEKFKQLPYWCITDVKQAFYDTESLTSIEQTARLYKTVRELIEGSNKFIDEINVTLEEFFNTFDQSIFEQRMCKIIHDYLDYMDNKLSKQDKNVNEAINYMKTNLTQTISNVIAEMKESGELNGEILSSIDNITSRLTSLENKKIPSKISELENDSDYASKEYVDNEIATFDFIKIVDPLPETGLDNRIYLVPKNTPDTENKDLFDEYIWANGKWEFITTKQIEIDLTPYYKKTEIDNTLNQIQNEVTNKINAVGEFIRAGLSAMYNCIDTDVTEKLPILTNLESKGDKLTITSDGGIRIGKGVNVVSISGQAYFYSGTPGHKIVNLFYNNSTLVRTNYRDCPASSHLSLPTIVKKVNEGDVIYLGYLGVSGDQIRDYTHGTFLQITVLN